MPSHKPKMRGGCSWVAKKSCPTGRRYAGKHTHGKHKGKHCGRYKTKKGYRRRCIRKGVEADTSGHMGYVA